MKLLALLFNLSGLCLLMSVSGCPATPWQTTLPEEMKDLNAKNLEKLKQRQIPGESFKVAFIADTQRDPYAFREVVRIINARKDIDQIAFMAILGDITDSGLLTEYEMIYDGLQESKLPFFGVIGNHDAISMGKDIFKEMFGPYDFVIPYKWAKFVAFNNNGLEFLNEVPDFEFLYKQSKLHHPEETYSHYVLLAHAPFFEGPRNTQEERQEFDQITNDLKLNTQDWGYLHGVFGHHHRFAFFSDNQGTYMKVDKVATDNLHYAMLEVFQDHIDYYFCTPDCQPAYYIAP